MINLEAGIKQISGLKHGESWVWPESDYGKAEVWCINDKYFVFEIPSFGNQPTFLGVYSSPESAAQAIMKLT